MSDAHRIAARGFLMSARQKRVLRRLGLFVADMAAVAAAVHLSLFLRFGDPLTTAGPLSAAALPATALCVLASALLFPLAGFYNRHWRYASVSDLVAIVRACLALGAVFTAAAFMWPDFFEVPRSVPAISVFVSVALLAGIRLTFRANEVATSLSLPRRRNAEAGRHVPIVVAGTERSIDLYLRALENDPHRAYRAVGALVAGAHEGLRIRNVPLMGTPANFKCAYDTLARQGRTPRHLVFTDRPAETDRAIVEQVTFEAERLGVGVFQVSSPTELRRADERETVALRPIELTDLLERPQLALDRKAVESLVAGRRILITGAGGSIGSELSRQVAAFGPSELTVTDSSEYNLYSIDLDLRETFPDVVRHSLLCNVRDSGRVNEIFDEFRPEVVFHAAALKHVPMVEANPCEGVLTNVIGTRNVVRAAARCNAMAMVQISTDKVVNPTSVMGATKRIAELYCQALDLAGEAQAAGAGARTRFMTVRFGNVLGSSGSLIPLFQRQLERGGPLTVTDARMKRFFMTIREAVELTLQASADGVSRELSRGKVYVLEMGEPIRIIDIARRMIRLAGFEPDRDIKIEIVGARPGEKLFEELFDSSEERLASAVPGVMSAVPTPIPLNRLEREMARLESWATVGDNRMVIESLSRMLPTYDPSDMRADARATSDRADRELQVAAE